jgi:hypothetical protein
MLQLDAILNKYNFLKRTIESNISIKEIENEIDFSLPDDYKYYLTHYNEFEGFLGPEYLKLFDRDKLLERNNDYQITDNLHNTIAIGNNGGGEYIAIEFMEPKNYRMVLSPFIDVSKEYHIEIGTSFFDMLIRLDNGKEWFN